MRCSRSRGLCVFPPSSRGSSGSESIGRMSTPRPASSPTNSPDCYARSVWRSGEWAAGPWSGVACPPEVMARTTGHTVLADLGRRRLRQKVPFLHLALLSHFRFLAFLVSTSQPLHDGGPFLRRDGSTGMTGNTTRDSRPRSWNTVLSARIGTINATSAGAAGVGAVRPRTVSPGGGPATARSRGRRRGSASSAPAGLQ